MITDIIDFTRKYHPNQNGITLKDKSLSPKKLKNKSKLKNISQLSKRKKKNYFTKRVGTVADSVNRKVQIDETGKLATKRKGSNANASRVNGKKKRGEPENERNSNRNDVWVEIGAIKLTYALREILDTPFAWLADDHKNIIE